MYDIQWFLMGHPIDEKDVEIEYKVEVDKRGTKNVPYLIRSQLEEIEVLEYEISTLQANALKRMEQLQDKIKKYEDVMTSMAREIRELERRVGHDSKKYSRHRSL